MSGKQLPTYGDAEIALEDRQSATTPPSSNEKGPGLYEVESPPQEGMIEYIDRNGDIVKAPKGTNANDLPAGKYDHTYASEGRVLNDAKDLVTSVIHVEDDPTINPWTFRMFFLGLGLAIFGSVLQEIFYFKPQVIVVSNIFLTVIAYALGEGMAFIIPREPVQIGSFRFVPGKICRFLNPGPFNIKEHAAISMCATAGAVSALATEALAAQSLYYGGYPNKGAGIFIVLSSQTFGYGIAGLLRNILVYPTKMLWPVSLPIVSLLENLHRDKRETKTRMRVFYIVFFVLFFWEVVPEYMFPLLAGVSVFCLAHQDSLVFTNLFGGSSGNEGLGLFSLSFDWNYIASTGSPIWVPLQTLVNSCIGYYIGIALFMGLYYGNIWNAQNFPFMSQLLYTDASTSTSFEQFDQSLILNQKFEIDYSALDVQGIPNMTASYLGYLITTNIGFTATFVHLMLWNRQDIAGAWSFLSPSAFRRLFKFDTYRFWDNEIAARQRKELLDDPNTDPHYKLIVANYDDAPQWWYGAVLIFSIIVGLVCLYVLKSTLPWWGFFVGLGLSTFMILFFGAQMAITGFQFNQQPISQMLAGYLFPGRPLANMYFTTFGFNAVQQGQYLLKDLKLAQYVHLSPKCAFTVQCMGCLVGALFNYVMMIDIVQNQREILLSVEGTNIWSGQNVQQFNTLAIAWSIASRMFSIGGKYQWVTISYLIGFLMPLPFYFGDKLMPKMRIFRYINTPVIFWYMGFLFVGVNSGLTSYFAAGFAAQFVLRVYYPHIFVKYNYLVSAAMDGGTQVCIFILTFAVQGGSGTAHPFPTWAGNNGGGAVGTKNLDYCLYNVANG